MATVGPFKAAKLYASVYQKFVKIVYFNKHENNEPCAQILHNPSCKKFLELG